MLNIQCASTFFSFLFFPDKLAYMTRFIDNITLARTKKQNNKNKYSFVVFRSNLKYDAIAID